MDILGIQGIQSSLLDQTTETKQTNADGAFDAIFQTAMNMLDETNELQNQAESLEIQFLLGEAENTHDLQIAQQKATTALNYTVAVRDKVIEAYNSIMNMQM